VKKIYFTYGLPRAGNTLLSCILNQNPRINTTANSIVPSVMLAVERVKLHDVVYKNFPDEESINNISKNLFDSYYKDWDGEIIIERGSWISPCNFTLLEQYFQSEIKIVVLVRDVLEVIKSYINICNKYPNFYINKQYSQLDHTTLYKSELEEKCDLIMERNGFVDMILYSIKWMLDNNKHKHLHFVHYNDLVENTEDVIKGIYKFFNIDFYEHTFTNIEQFSSNDIKYDDNSLGIGSDIHTIRAGKIEFVDNQVELSPRIINKFSGFEFWSHSNQ
tara:strand:+ start:478 stop:1305 length:828 start_codon:yes stop_codon:yes gene_type:complete